MTTYDRRIQTLAVCLSALAGYVDAIGFLSLNGFFVSFMSGNSTRMSVALAQRSMTASIAAALIVLFVLGVVAGSLTARIANAHRRPAVLTLVAALLGAAASFGMLGATEWSIVAMTLAMGAMNAVFERDGEVHVGVTYMTGTLVKLGQRITAAILGGDRLAWMPYLFLWLGLVAGAFVGAVVYPYVGLDGLWVAASGAAALAYAAHLTAKMAHVAADRHSDPQPS